MEREKEEVLFIIIIRRLDKNFIGGSAVTVS